MDNGIQRATAATVLNSLSGGVVPRVGLEYITVGRRSEIAALLQDVAMIESGGCAMRFIEGRYGSGKTFLLYALKNHVLERNFVVSDVELSVDKRLVGNKGQGLAAYRELMRNLATQACPDHGALRPVLDKWISKLENEVEQECGLIPGHESFDIKVSQKVHSVTSSMEERVNGFDFGRVVSLYYKGHRMGDDKLQQKAFRWLCGEYRTKSEAKTDLGISLIITDDNWYDFIKLWADFMVKVGYAGFYICMDELASIYEIPSKVGRDYNYSKLLTIYNDILQGKAFHLGFLMGITREAMEDSVRGIYGYEPLRSRLQDKMSDHATLEDLRDMAASVIHLSPLNPGEIYVLIEKITQLHGIVYEYEPRLEHDDYIYFLKNQYARAHNTGELTARDMIRNYITLLNLTQQNSDRPKEEILYACEHRDIG